MIPFTRIPWAYVVCVSAIVVSAAVGYSKGKAAADMRCALQEASTQADMRAQADEAVRRAQADHALLRNKLHDINTKAYEAENAYSEKIKRLSSSLRSGADRLYITTRAVHTAAETRNPKPSTGVVEETRSELLPEVAASLVELAADADAEVRRTNICIDYYTAVKASE